MNLKWEINTTERKYHLNLCKYTSIYNVEDTKEEDIINIIYRYFQPRSKIDDIKIYDQLNETSISGKEYTAFMISNDSLIEEFELSSSSLLNKKIHRMLAEDSEVGMYINTVNTLLDDSLMTIKEKVPIKIDDLDYKKLLKMIKFDFEAINDNQTGYLQKLILVLPLIIQEIYAISKVEPILIYNHPESYLSPNEQITLRKFLDNQKIKIVVLTESEHFLSDSLEGINIYKKNEQIITEKFLEKLYWDAPLNFKNDKLVESLYSVIKRYISKFELKPTITNYKIGDIILFEPIDIYVCVKFMEFCNYDYIIDFKEQSIPEPLHKYIINL